MFNILHLYSYLSKIILITIEHSKYLLKQAKSIIKKDVFIHDIFILIGWIRN